MCTRLHHRCALHRRTLTVFTSEAQGTVVRNASPLNSEQHWHETAWNTRFIELTERERECHVSRLPKLRPRLAHVLFPKRGQRAAVASHSVSIRSWLCSSQQRVGVAAHHRPSPWRRAPPPASPALSLRAVVVMQPERLQRAARSGGGPRLVRREEGGAGTACKSWALFAVACRWH